MNAPSSLRRAARARAHFIAQRRAPATVEALEQRIVPAAIFWDGGGDGSTWTSANNWSNNQLPTAADDVTISPAGLVTVTLNTGAQAVRSISVPGDDTLSITAGSLAFTAASSITNLALSGSGLLSANAALSLTGNGSWSGEGTLGGTSVVTNTGTLAIVTGGPNLQTELRNAGVINHGSAYLDFVGSEAELRIVSGGLYNTVNTNNDFTFRSVNGGFGTVVEAGGVFRHNGGGGSRFLTSDGSNPRFDVLGGTVDVVNGTLGINSSGVWTNATLTVAAGQALNFLNGSNITINGTLGGSGAGVVNLHESGTLTIPAAGATFTFPAGLFQWSSEGNIVGPGALTNAGIINISGGGPNLHTELRNAAVINHGNAYLDFVGADAELRILNGGVYTTVNSSNDFTFRSVSGGFGTVVEAGGIFRHNGGGGARFLTSDGSNPRFDVLAGGRLDVVSGTLGINNTGAWTNATLTVAAGQALNFLNGSNITINGTLGGSGAGVVNLHESGTLTIPAAGATFTFPAGLFQWSSEGNIVGPGALTNAGIINISGGGPNLHTELRNAAVINHGNAYLDFNGADAELRILNGGVYQTVNTSNDFTFRKVGSGFGAVVEAGGVFRHNSASGARFLTSDGSNPRFDVLAGGRLDVVSGTFGINASGEWTGATLTVAAGHALNFLNGSNITIRGTLGGSGAGAVNLHENGTLLAAAEGATLNFPAGLFQWNSEGNLAGPGVFTNTGILNLAGGGPNLHTELRNTGLINHGNAYLDFIGAAGELRVLSGGVYQTVNTSNDFTLRRVSGGFGATVEAGGVFRHNSASGARFLTSDGSNPTFDVSSGTLDVVKGTLGINGTGAWTNASLTAAAGAALNFLNGSNITINGTLGGSGSGAVNLHENGTLLTPAEGATLNFPAGLFQWSAEGNLAGPGVLTNAGVINITGGGPNLQTELRNAGLINHGNAYLDFVGTAGQLRIVSGGVYETTNTSNDFSFRKVSGGLGTVVEPGGLFRHNSASGARFLTNDGSNPSFSNEGTVEAVKGTLFFNGPLAQRVGNALTGGEWIVRSGAVLNLNGALTSNAGTVTIEGTGSFPGLGTLAGNTGSLTLRAGADLTTTAAFTNSGLLHLGEGSVFTAPSFTQAAAGTLEFEIGGTTTADYGRLAIANAATFGGTARVLIAPDYSPATGQVLTLATYGSTSGNSLNFEGLDLTRTRVFGSFLGATALTVSSLVNAANLDAVSISAPASGLAGQDFAISYTVQNTSAFPTFATTWTDTIYLSLDDVLDPADLVLTRVTHTGAVAGGGSYTESVTVPLTGTITGSYKVLVLADSRGFVADPDRGNNLVAATTTSTLDIPQLTDGVAITGTIRAGQQLWYRITLPAGETPNFLFTGAVAGEAEVYTGFGEVPTRADYLQKGFSLTSTVQQVVGDVTAAGTYYVLLHGRESAGAGQPFSLRGEGVGFELTSSAIAGGANVGKVTTTLSGAQFSPETNFALLLSSGATRPAEATYFVNARTVHATFDLTGLAAGTYDIVATKGLATDTLDDSFAVTSGGTPGTLKFSITSPRFVRPQGGNVTITYENVGQTDLEAPLFNLLAENARLRLSGESDFIGAAYQIGGKPFSVTELLGVSGGLAGVLSPGEKGSIELSFQAINAAIGAKSKFELLSVGSLTDPFDLATLVEELKPEGLQEDAWQATFANFQAGIGNTLASYRQMLVENANYLGQFENVSPLVTRLLEFEFEQAGGFGEIEDRFRDGALGRGQTVPFSLRSSADMDGNVVLTDGEKTRFFFLRPGGSYTGSELERGTLTRDTPGNLTLTEATGEKTLFRASDGRIEYVEDTNGHRLTPGYDGGGRLLSVTDSVTGDVTTFAYNSGGRIASITDAVGRVASYTYDSSGEHIASVTTPQGTTTFTYLTGQGDAREHALASVTGPDGVTTSFTYDTRGRLTTRTVGSGADALVTSYEYDNAGTQTIIEPGGRESSIFRTVGGLVARTIEPLGEVTTIRYDALGRIVSVTDPSGFTSRTPGDSSGLLSGVQEADRSQVGITLAGENLRLQNVTDPGGDMTRFAYDVRGNLLSTTLPDGSATTYEYDVQGRVTVTTDANGQRSTFTYNGDGLVTRRTFPGGQIDFTYDAHRNPLTATDSEGTTTFTYDAADRITSVAYPNGKSVAITYDAAGRRTTVADGTGYTVRYAYDSLGRLDQVRDTGNALLVDYGYDAAGQLASETRGNGSSTLYSYDAGGRLATIAHRNAANASIGGFAYTYDEHDRVKTVATADGTTTYTYDLAGQLTGVALPGGRTVTYAYDAEGNRTSVVDSAAGAESYTTNVGDQYLTAGEETLAYDRDGRLITRTQGGVTTSYTYDAFGRLDGITAPGSVTTFDYDALGTRIGKTENGVRTDFANDPFGLGTLFGEYRGATATHYASGLGVAARESAGSTAFYHFDSAGNTALVSGAGGAALATYKYLPFGEISAQTGSLAQPFTFNGQLGVQDDPGDLFHMRARAFDAELGRFTTRDPVGFFGGDTNLYRFVQNDPVNRADPSGLVPIPAGALAATGFYNGVLPGTALPALYVAPTPIGGALVAETSTALGSYTGVSSSAGFGSALTTELGTVGATGAAGIVGLGSLALAAGLVVGTLADEITEVTHPELKQAFREGIKDRFGFDKDGKAQFDPDFIQDWGRNPHFTDIVKKGLASGQTQEEAILDAIRLLKKYDLDKVGREQPLDNPNKTESETVRPSDPNNVIGPAGAGADPVPAVIAPGQVRFDGFVNGGADFGYTIQFENQPSATAPAQVVKVTQTLDSDLDFSTFRYTSFGFGDFKIDVPADADGTSFETIFDGALEELGVRVQIRAELNTVSGLVDVTFTSLDPLTNEVPADPIAGFLPPNLIKPQGDGFLTYTVAPKDGLANGTRFDALANIVFDTEGAIATPFVHNTLDFVAPVSQITNVSGSISRTTFSVRWTVSDPGAEATPRTGSGVSGTTILYTDTFNGVEGALQPLVVDEAGFGTRFTGGQVGHTYKFFSQAIDAVGNVEALPATPDATITVVAPELLEIGRRLSFRDADGDRVTVTYAGRGSANLVLVDPDQDGNGSIDQIFVTGGNAASKLTVAVRKAGGGDGAVGIGDVHVTGDLGAFIATKSDLTIEGFLATGAVKTIAVRDLLRPDPILADPVIELGGTATSRTALTARTVADGFSVETAGVLSLFRAVSIGTGDISAGKIDSLQTTRGGLAADVMASGAIGKILVRGGDVSGDLVARSFGLVSVSGGDFSGSLTSAATATALGRVNALSALSVTGGDFLGDVQVLGKAGSIAVKARAGIGGNIDDATIIAAQIAAVTVSKNVTDSILLAGADLGADRLLGGSGGNADGFGAGSIGAVKIGGTATRAIIGAGLDPVDLIFDNGNDVILGGAVSRIASLIAGGADSESYFAAGRFSGLVKIAGARIAPATDDRFLVG